MTRGPPDDPLGAKPTLPPPAAAGAKRAASLFRQLIEIQRSDDAESPGTGGAGHTSRRAPSTRGVRATVAANETAPYQTAKERRRSFAREGSGGGRRYDRASALVEGLAAEQEASVSEPEPPEMAPESDPEPGPDREAQAAGEPSVQPESAAVPTDPTAVETLRHPPHGAPTVRASVPAPEAPVDRDGHEAADTRGLLRDTARGAMVIEEPDGGLSFDIEFKDEVFRDLACRITTKDGKVFAVFRVQDVNTRRLIEAEAGRLRSQLEGRGLKVQAVKVEVVG